MSTQSAMIQVRPDISKFFDAIRVLRRLQLEFEGSERKLPSQNQNPNKGSVNGVENLEVENLQ